MELSTRQRRIVAAAITVLSVVTILAAVAALFWLIARFFGAFAHVFLPVAFLYNPKASAHKNSLVDIQMNIHAFHCKIFSNHPLI